jgi:putative SOS response-associated peptidase YedK
MCNRYRTAKDIEKLRAIFSNAPADWFEGSDKKYDTVYPKSKVPVYLRVKGQDYFNNFQWGIHPAWANTPGQILTNTKSEEVLNKPTWTEAFKRRRCLMPATAFYEPATVDGKKYQMRFELKSGEAFSFAAIWEKTDRYGTPVNCCSLLTTEPNELVGEVHGRMPMILPQRHYDRYLNTPPEEAASLVEILQPYPAEEMIGAFDSESS